MGLYFRYHITQENIKMIDVVYGFKVAPGKRAQAKEWAGKLIAYAKKAGLSGTLFFLRPRTGEINEIAFVFRHSSMAEYEEAVSKRVADSGFLALVKERDESGWSLGYAIRIYEVVEG